MLSPDNTQIVYTEGDAALLETEVVLMDVNGRRRQVLTSGANVFGGIPTFSPSGMRVAYAEWLVEGGERRHTAPQIAIRDLRTGEKVQITGGTRETWRPVFSPDESRLAYIARSSGQYDLFIYDFADGSERQLTSTPFDEWDPAFAPDGGKLVFAARPEQNWDLFEITLGDGISRRLTQTKGDEWDPAFTRSGDALLFGGRFGFLEAVFRMPVDADSQGRSTADTSVEAVNEGSGR
jgi:TolB protein